MSIWVFESAKLQMMTKKSVKVTFDLLAYIWKESGKLPPTVWKCIGMGVNFSRSQKHLVYHIRSPLESCRDSVVKESFPGWGKARMRKKRGRGPGKHSFGFGESEIASKISAWKVAQRLDYIYLAERNKTKNNRYFRYRTENRNRNRRILTRLIVLWLLQLEALALTLFAMIIDV